MNELNCIGCGRKGCDGKTGCDWYDSQVARIEFEKQVEVRKQIEIANAIIKENKKSMNNGIALQSKGDGI